MTMTAKPPVWRYLWNLLISVDQGANALTGGDPDETISSRIAKRQDTCAVCRALCRLLHLLDPYHCDKSREPDEGKDAVL